MAEENKEKYSIDFQTNADAAAKDVQGLRASIDQSTEATKKNTAAGDAQEEQYKNFKTQLREANQELQKSIQIYGETSQQAVKAAKGVADLKDQMGFAKDLADTFNPDQKFKALGAATQVAGTGLQGVTAGMALFGGESEDTQKQLLKVQAAMAFSDAISNLSNVADQWAILKTAISSSTIIQKANTAATGAAAIVQNLFTGSVTTTTTGFKALKFAIAATGIGLLVVGLVAVVQNFEKISKWTTNLVPGLADVGDAIGNIVQVVTDFVGVTSEADRAIDRLKSNADASLALNKKFLAEHGSQLDEFTKQKIAAKDEYSNAIKEDGANQVALAKELNRKLAAIEYSRGDEAREIAKENAEKAAEEAQKRREKALEDEKKAQEKAISDKQEYIEKANSIEEEFDNLRIEKKIREEKEAEEKREKDLEDLAQRAQDAADVANNNAEEEKRRQDTLNAIQTESKDRMLANGESLARGVQALAGKNKAVQKAAIIAEGGINLGKSISNTAAAVTSDLKLGFPANIAPIALDIATGAVSAASIVSGTNKALQAVGGGGSITAPAAQQVPSGVSAAPQTGFQASSENQIATSISSQQNQTPIIKTYVVGSEVKTQTDLDAKLIQQNSFG